MKKIQIAAGVIFTLTLVMAVHPSSSYAQFGWGRQERREEAKEKNSTPPGLLQKMANKFGRASVINGTLSAKSGTTLTVVKNGTTYTVLTDGKTQLRRRFWGKSSLDEMQAGDLLNIHGKWTDDAHTTIQATLVRDLSIQKRSGVFFGTITSLTGSGWVMQTIRRGNQTVTVSANTRFVNIKGETISQSDILVGHRVRVKGLWDNKANTVTEVTHVKDYNLPLKATPTPKS